MELLIVFVSSFTVIGGLIVSMLAIDSDALSGEEPQATVMLAVGIAMIILGIMISFVR